MKHFLTFLLIIFMLFLILTLGSCGKSELEYFPDTGAAQVETSGGSQEEPGNIENDVMFFNSKVNFAFIYPQEHLIISSCPCITEDYNSNLFLNVSINFIDNLTGSEKEEVVNEKEALESGNAGSYPDYSFEPSRKLTRVSDTFVKEFLTLSGYDDTLCGITFDREARFYNNGYQVRIILSAGKDKIVESMDQYFINDGTDCPGQKAWDPNKQDEFYEKLTTGPLSGPALEWYDTFEDIMYLLQINDFKGATGGYSRLIDRRFFEESTDKNYLISVSYPQFQSAVAGGLDESINKIIYEQKVLSIISDFKEEISSYEDEGACPNYLLTMDYTIYMYDENGISVCFDIYPYLGGAHGLLYFETINFDLEKMNQVEIGELFVSNYNYYSSISGYCRESLTRQINDMGFEPDIQLLENGTDQDCADNFRNFLVAPYGLIIKFPAYQVAPYAAGSFSVNIPYEEFKGNLNPESIIRDYNN